MQTTHKTATGGAISASQLHSLAGAVYGARWQSQMARDMGIALRTVQRWASHGIDKTPTADSVRRFLEGRRVSRISGPPEDSTPDDDRDRECHDSLAPAVQALVAAATDVGWSSDEALIAVMNATIDLMERQWGAELTLATLREVVVSFEGDQTIAALPDAGVS